MQVTYYYFSNPEQQEAIQRLLEKWRWVLPPWLQTFRVHMVALEPNVMAQTRFRVEYLKASLDVCPAFFDDTPEVQEAEFVHELCHAQFAEVTDWARELISKLTADEKLKEVLRDELRVRVERVTEGLCLALTRRNGGG